MGTSMLKPHLNSGNSFQDCGVFVRVAPVLSDAQTTLSAGTDVSVADFAKRADYAVAEFTSNVTLIPTRPNNTPTTLSALTAGSVGIEKQQLL